MPRNRCSCHDDEVYAKLVIAEGSNIIIGTSWSYRSTDPRTMAVGVKEVYKPKKRILKIASCYFGDEGMRNSDMTDGH
ncbi:MAG: hypothetical protein ACLR5T_02700 [Veillonella sp.]